MTELHSPANQPAKSSQFVLGTFQLQFQLQQLLRQIRSSFHLFDRDAISLLTAMRPLSSSAGSALRTWTRHTLPSSNSRLAVAATPSSLTATPSSQSSLEQRRYAQGGAVGAPHAESSFDSPFGRTSESAPSTTKIPSFKAYMSKNNETTNRVIQYFMVGTMGLLSAAGAKATVQGMSESDRSPHTTLLFSGDQAIRV